MTACTIYIEYILCMRYYQLYIGLLPGVQLIVRVMRQRYSSNCLVGLPLVLSWASDMQRKYVRLSLSMLSVAIVCYHISPLFTISAA